VDAHGYVRAASPVRTGALVCIGTIALVWISGMLRGGDFGSSLWQVFRVIYLPCVLLLFAAGLRGPGDARRLGVTLVAAALLRAVVAISVRLMFPDTEAVPHATTHADSMLFADAFLLILVWFAERPTTRSLLLGVGTLPILAWGMVANNRRLVWVELGFGLLTIFFLTPWGRVKRRVAQAVVVSLPLLLLYVGIGWSHPTGVFAPVRTVRSVVDSGSDSSTAWRDWENYNLYYTLKDNPVLGTGFGHGYTEVVHLPDISQGYSLYRYAPHNSILGLLAFGGFLGFAGIWMLIPLGIFFAARAYRFSTQPRDRVAALTTIGVLVAYMVHCYGDMGLGTWTSVFTVAPALALVAKLATASGAWPGRAGARTRVAYERSSGEERLVTR
jgi:multisubunit Na+/H+ antiporter MnhF subunit